MLEEIANIIKNVWDFHELGWLKAIFIALFVAAAGFAAKSEDKGAWALPVIVGVLYLVVMVIPFKVLLYLLLAILGWFAFMMVIALNSSGRVPPKPHAVLSNELPKQGVPERKTFSRKALAMVVLVVLALCVLLQ